MKYENETSFAFKVRPNRDSSGNYCNYITIETSDGNFDLVIRQNVEETEAFKAAHHYLTELVRELESLE